MQKSAKLISRVQPTRKPAAPTTKTAQAQTGPQQLDEQQLRQVSGGGGLPVKGW